MNNLFAAAFFCCVFVLPSCKTKKMTSEKELIKFDVKASAQRYHAALGAGEGVLFLVYLNPEQEIDRTKILIDSFLVNHTQIEASLRKDSLVVVEGNYFVPKTRNGPDAPERANTDGKDPILNLGQYYPAILYIHYLDSAYALSITEFESISE